MLPYLQPIHRYQQTLEQFGGLNRRAVIGADEFEELVNLCGDDYPALSTRQSRYTFVPYRHKIAPNTKLFWKDGLIELVPQESGADRLYYNGVEVTDWRTKGLSQFSELPVLIGKQTATADDISVCSIGSVVLFVPYRSWFDTADLTDNRCGSVGYGSTYYNKGIAIDVVHADYTSVGHIYDNPENDPPSSPNVGDMWYVSNGNEILQYKNIPDEGNQWRVITELGNLDVDGYCYYFQMDEDVTLPTKLTEGDEVTIKFTYDFNFERYVTHKITGQVVQYDTTSTPVTFCIYSKKPNKEFMWQLIYDRGGAIPGQPRGVQPITLTISTGMPSMRYVTALNNRIWGCDIEGHEIFCSKLGDAGDYVSALGNAAAWHASVGEGGEWTGAVTYNKTVYFFKRDRMFRVTGTRPSNFGYTEISTRGCYDNASIAVVADRLMYMGEDGIYQYMETYPTRISDKVGGTWKYAVGGAFRNKYYVCRTGEDDTSEVLHYDLEKGAWYKDSDEKWYSMTQGEDTLYYTYDRPYRLRVATAITTPATNSVTVEGALVTGSNVPIGASVTIKGTANTVTAASSSGTNTALTLATAVSNVPEGTVIEGTWHTLGSILPTGATYEGTEDPVKWSCVTGDQMADVQDRKYVTGLYMQMKLGTGARCKVYLQYDLDGNWIPIADITRANKDVETIRFIPRRCRHFKLKFSGVGKFTLISITKTIEEAYENG